MAGATSFAGGPCSRATTSPASARPRRWRSTPATRSRGTRSRDLADPLTSSKLAGPPSRGGGRIEEIGAARAIQGQILSVPGEDVGREVVVHADGLYDDRAAHGVGDQVVEEESVVGGVPVDGADAHAGPVAPDGVAEGHVLVGGLSGRIREEGHPTRAAGQRVRVGLVEGGALLDEEPVAGVPVADVVLGQTVG